MKSLTIAGAGLRRLFRWRANVFFLFLLPMLIILLLGAAFGGSDVARMGVVREGEGARSLRLVERLDAHPAVEVEIFEDTDAALRSVERGRTDVALVVPGAVDGRLASGETAVLRFLARPDSIGQQLRQPIDSVVAEENNVLRAIAFLNVLGVEPAARREQLAQGAAGSTPGISVRQRIAGGSEASAERFGASASSQLLLFVFLNGLNAAVWLVESRRLGVSRRMLATPTSIRTVVAGEVLARLGITLVQALVIVVGAGLLFGVDWGAPLGAGAVILSFCLVGAGAGTLLGATARTDAQAGAIALLLGLPLAALGGSMVPLEVFPPFTRTLADLTPHAWGNEAFHELIDRGAEPADVLPEIGVLLGYAAVLLTLASWQLRRAITT